MVKIVKKKGAGTKLFNCTTQNSTTLAEVQALIESGETIVVLERDGGLERDITAAILLSIIERAERKAQKLPVTMLHALLLMRVRPNEAQ